MFFCNERQVWLRRWRKEGGEWRVVHPWVTTVTQAERRTRRSILSILHSTTTTDKRGERNPGFEACYQVRRILFRCISEFSQSINGHVFSAWEKKPACFSCAAWRSVHVFLLTQGKTDMLITRIQGRNTPAWTNLVARWRFRYF